jgi:hypothetical protein
VLATTTLGEMAKQDLALEEGSVVTPADSHRKVRTSLEVEDWVHIERDADTIVKKFQHDGWMAHHVGDAYVEAESLRARVDPGGLAWKGTTVPAVRLGPPTSLPDGATRLGLAWELSLAGGGRVTPRWRGTAAFARSRADGGAPGWTVPPTDGQNDTFRTR